MLPEYEGKQFLRSIGVCTPDGLLIDSPENLLQGLQKQKLSYPCAVKAQVASGGRGKSGGVLRAEDQQQAAAAGEQLFRSVFNGERPGAVLIEPWLPVEQEMYLSVTVDGPAEGYVVLFSPNGGINVEEGSDSIRYPVGAPWQFRSHEFRLLLEDREIESPTCQKVIALAQRLVVAASSWDCCTVEVNPLGRLPDGNLVALDAKIVLDEWADFRSQTILQHKRNMQLHAHELVRACLDMKHMYVRLEGEVGLISGGAGMTMAVMDLIQEMGGRPACFLDCSPGPASANGYRPAFALLDGDPQVRVILVSIYGGGTQMQRVARGLIDVLRDRRSQKPVVLRLNGTHIDQVPAIFAELGAKNHGSLEDAVKEAVALTRRDHEHSA